MKNKTYANRDVLEFYKKLPFNIYSDKAYAIESLKSNNPIKIYPPLADIIKDEKNFYALDLGCGAGWFANLLSYNFKNINVYGVDFNPIAINFANEVKKELNLKTNFLVEDLFKINFRNLNLNTNEIDLISSLGVLHHTNNCHQGIKKIIELKPKFFLLGLYHKYGRQPFLDYFKELKIKYHHLNNREYEDSLFKEYKKLDRRSLDDIHLKSWFKDQVLHPLETQHTLAEISSIMLPTYEIISTSVNKFNKINSLSEIINKEKKLYEHGVNQIKKNIYFPGFFVILAIKK